MTRETKIGLLVGLAFIIVIGILLSEHVSSTNEPQQALLNTAGANVRDGVATPGVSDDGPPITIAGTPVEAPRQPVPTNADLHPPAPKVAYVPPAPRRAGQGRPATSDGGPATTLSAGANPDPDAASTSRDGMAASSSTQQHRNIATNDPNGSAPPAALARQLPATPPVTYVAVAGDSVSRIAARLMGGNTKANRELLIRANPLLQNDGNVVVIGRTYVVPRASGDSGSAQTAAGALPASHDSPAIDSAARPAEPTRWYTVKGDDNLWRIAASQLGSGTAWTQIRDLNKDVLKGGETVHPNMRLRLPSKTAVAGAD